VAAAVALFAQGLMPSVWMRLAEQALGLEIENGERQRARNDPAPLSYQRGRWKESTKEGRWL